jgi:hypothetical protein
LGLEVAAGRDERTGALLTIRIRINKPHGRDIAGIARSENR